MNKKIAVGASILIIIIMIVAAFLPMLNVIGAPPQPYNRYGVAYDSAASSFDNGTKITSYVDGVLYGTNYTWTSTGLGKGSYDMDVIGDDPTSDNIKEGGYAPENVMYAIGGMTGTGTARICEEVGSWETGGSISGDLNEASSDQPVLLKINNITTQPSDAGNQYLYIYGPEDTDMTDYYLEKNDGSINGPTVVDMTGVIPASGLYYADIFAVDFLNVNGDELKLVWKNSGTAFGGNDIVVDRIEFNASTGGTHYGVPDNTRIDYLVEDDAAAPGSGEEMYRTSMGQDTDDCSADFGIQAETGKTIEQKFKIEFVAGLNLISMPLNVTDPDVAPFDAQDLIDLINGDGGGALSVSRWLAATGVWDTFNDGSASPFEINAWEGYFINCNIASTWNATGKPKESEPVDLVAGLTLIGISKDLKDPTASEPSGNPYYSAQDIVNEINADGGSAQAVSRWIAATGTWDTFNDGGASPFRVERGVGYFVNNDAASTWTP
jgi:hypothetical protein